MMIAFQPGEPRQKWVFNLREVLFIAVSAAIWCALPAVSAQGDEPYAKNVKRYDFSWEEQAVIGIPTWHDVAPQETLLDLARKNGLGYNEMILLYPKMDPWMPPPGARLEIPSQWILPPTKLKKVVVNLPEMRLYFFESGRSAVQTYPVAIGAKAFQTPRGTFVVTEKRRNPIWYIPESLQEKYGTEIMEPGPENPMGEFLIKFSAGPYAIHGTHMAWGVGRTVSHGCIRLYPEDMRLLYPQVREGTKLEIIYEPIKLGQSGQRIFVEVHPDIYEIHGDMQELAEKKLRAYPLARYVDVEAYRWAVKIKRGIPTDVTDLIESLSWKTARKE